MTASIGGFLGSSYKAVLNNDGTVTYQQNPVTFVSLPGTKRALVSVPDERWRQFREKLDQAGVWRWNTMYVEPNVVDGTTWEIMIEYEDCSIQSKGSNAYPRHFDQVLKAVSELLGGKDFR